MQHDLSPEESYEPESPSFKFKLQFDLICGEGHKPCPIAGLRILEALRNTKQGQVIRIRVRCRSPYECFEKMRHGPGFSILGISQHSGDACIHVRKI